MEEDHAQDGACHDTGDGFELVAGQEETEVGEGDEEEQRAAWFWRGSAITSRRTSTLMLKREYWMSSFWPKQSWDRHGWYTRG